MNPELLPHLTVRSEPRISIPQGEMVRLEQALLSFQDTQNFLFWLIGAVVTLMSDSDGLSRQGPMLQQIVPSIQWAMVDQARVTTFALTNTRAARRES